MSRRRLHRDRRARWQMSMSFMDSAGASSIFTVIRTTARLIQGMAVRRATSTLVSFVPQVLHGDAISLLPKCLSGT